MEHIIILIDISYSMYSKAEYIISGLNNFIESLRHRDDSNKILITVIVFCQKITYLCCGVPVKNVEIFNVKQLPTFGTTFLYDAIGIVINDWINEYRLHHNLYIITDGDDTGSNKVTKEEANKLCEQAVQDYDWNITYCGIDTGKLISNSIKRVIYDVNNVENLLSNLVLV